ncbi:MOSC domain-containing protein [Nocardioides baculatus]|uniref:MOSC domain-containing protein n=1 Tax=Nocardioides baculatus TaxID=2801337 RepID=A0ABS1L9P0_9ACTN|nr:MOSC domain-containing protein [Nocardioides baculatus]MBL0748138.1 MOSC domain-containing protein [Nocardioides baculatus]
MQLLGVNVHPLKSGAIRPVRSIEVRPGGLRGDRTWMVVDSDARLVSAREVHALFHVVADTPDTDQAVGCALRLRAPGLPDLLLDEPGGDPEPVRLFSLDLLARPAGPDADAWLRAALGRDDVRLVWCDDPTRRTLQPGFSLPGDHAAFPDSFPVTVASLASLRRLNDWIAERALELGEEPPEPLPIERFRANLVVDGDEPFAEDQWEALTINGVRFRVTKPVGRCVMTTIDATTLTTAKEPIRTLARHRLVGGKTMFAAHLVPEGSGTIVVGDEVTVS